MKIRAHHLLCMQGFQGYGYSEDFSKNMAEIIEILQNFPEHEIEIVAETDSICTCCPYNINGKCQESQGSLEYKVFGGPKSKILTANNRIISMDLKVLKKLDISPGSIFEAGEIFKITNEKLKTYFDVKDICGDCRWSEKCLWYLKKCAVSTDLISK
ncbi:DUF1284 domain-containing protein [Methanobacterium sp. MBAC-LM]|uniref:DUF1284 domain-containing protein n=1 Tax=Methanobacterium sp. MBAC-LM TaxID=3412034 RepID=UPI003C752759